MKRLAVVIAFIAIVLGLSALGYWANAQISIDRTQLTPYPPAEAARIPIDARLPHPKHIIVVFEENKSFGQIAGRVRQAPYLNALIAHGALFTNAHAVAHPSQPNYIAFFGGVTNDNGDGCTPTGYDAAGANLASELAAAEKTFAGYAEGLPFVGYRGCIHGEYARKHAPWNDFSNVPASDDRPLRDLPAPEAMPQVAFIAPNLLNDMHSASVARADAWLHRTLGPLIARANRTDTLVIITWDEGAGDSAINHIPTIFFGPMVRPGRYDDPIDNYRVLRTIEALSGIPAIAHAREAAPIADAWR